MKILLLIAAFFFSYAGFCQKEEYLVKTNGDTLWGDINLRNNVFRIGNENLTSINAADVKSIHSKKYKGSIVVPCKLQLYTDNIDALEMNNDPVKSVDTVMVLGEIFNTPKINLYFGRDIYKSDYYFYKTPADSLPVQLVVRYYLDGGLDNYADNPGKYSGVNSTIHIVEVKGYVNQLFFIMGDCGKIPETMWELLTYRNFSLIQLIKKYNKCK